MGVKGTGHPWSFNCLLTQAWLCLVWCVCSDETGLGRALIRLVSRVKADATPSPDPCLSQVCGFLHGLGRGSYYLHWRNCRKTRSKFEKYMKEYMKNRLIDSETIKQPGTTTDRIYISPCVLYFTQVPMKVGHGSSTASCFKSSVLESVLTASAHTHTHAPLEEHRCWEEFSTVRSGLGQWAGKNERKGEKREWHISYGQEY